MKKDIEFRSVDDVLIAILPQITQPEGQLWEVYLINLKATPISSVLVSSKGFGEVNGEDLQTSALRHFFASVPALSYQKIENIHEDVFNLNNQYWLSFSHENHLYDRKFLFPSESIHPDNFDSIPLINRQGITLDEPG
ncbi:MAG: hypothetical protein AAFV07_04980 [Bacteroidota bacterium]